MRRRLALLLLAAALTAGAAAGLVDGLRSPAGSSAPIDDNHPPTLPVLPIGDGQRR